MASEESQREVDQEVLWKGYSEDREQEPLQDLHTYWTWMLDMP